jgi:hypothetical protein
LQNGFQKFEPSKTLSKAIAISVRQQSLVMRQRIPFAYQNALKNISIKFRLIAIIACQSRQDADSNFALPV